MNLFKSFLLLAVVACVGFTACKGDGAAKDDTRESLATPSTTAEATPPAAANPADAIPAGPLTTISFEESSYDFGDIQDGDVVTHMFKFKNTGEEPLIISNAKGSCGCTVPQWPREPIPPGGSGELKVEYNSKNKGNPDGRVESKKVTVTANTDPAQTFITIKGKVFKPADTPS